MSTVRLVRQLPGTVQLQTGFAPPPTVTSITSIFGPWRSVPNGVTGTGFLVGATVSIGGLACTGVVVNSTTSISFNTPVEVANGGPYDVLVSNHGSLPATLPAAYWVFADPHDFPGLVEELYGDAGVAKTGSSITSWTDQSGTGNSLTPPATSPTFNAAGALAIPYVNFNGTTDYLAKTSMAFGGAGNLSVFTLQRLKANGLTVPVSYNGLQVARVYNTATAQLWRNSGAACTPQTQALNRWIRETGIIRAAGTEASWSNGIDAQTSAVGGAITTSGVDFALGARSTGALPSNIDIAACLVYNTDQSANHIPIEEYLRVRAWGGIAPPMQSLDTSSPASSYAGVTYGRTGASVVVATSASTAATLASGAPLYENRDGVVFGLWTFPAFTNDAAQDVTTWSPVHSATITALAAGTAPDGVGVAYQVNDTDVANVAGASFTVSGNDSRVQSVWVRDHVGTAPTSPGMLGSNMAQSGASLGGVSLGSGTAWRRVSYADNQTGNVTAMQIMPAGAQPATSTAGATGAVDVWAPSSVSQLIPFPPVGGTADYPTVLGSTGAATIQVDPTKIVSFGELDVEGKCSVMFGAQDGDITVSDRYLFAATSSEGLMSLRYTQSAGSNTLVLTVRGVDVLTVPAQLQVTFAAGDDFAWRCWYRQSTNQCGIRIWTNGAFQELTGLSSGGPLVAPTIAYVGSDVAGANGFAALHTKPLIAHVGADLAPVAPEFIMIGDSISTGFSFCHMPASWIYARDINRRSKPGCAMLGISGGQIVTQQTIYDASPYKGQANVKAIIIQVGTNDIGHISGAGVYVTAAAFVAAYNALIADVRAAHPTAKIYGLEISPCRASDTAPQYALWQAVNASFTGGATPIVGLDRVISSHVAALNDGADNLAAAFSLDGLHPNEAGRKIIGLAIRAGLLADGLVT